MAQAELNFDAAGNVLLDAAGNLVVTAAACCCLYVRAQDPCTNYAYANAWFLQDTLPPGAGYLKCGGVCYFFQAGNPVLPEELVPAGHLKLDGAACTLSTAADPACCPATSCLSADIDGANSSYLVHYTIAFRDVAPTTICAPVCTSSNAVSLAWDDQFPNPRHWSRGSDDPIAACLDRTIRPPVMGYQASGCYWFVQFPDYVGTGPSCFSEHRKYYGNRPTGNYFLYTSNGPCAPALCANTWEDSITAVSVT